MTNEEKAKELMECAKCPFRNQFYYNEGKKLDSYCDRCADKRAILAFANWKDEAHQDELDMINAKIEDTQRNMKALNALLDSKEKTIKSAYKENADLRKTIIEKEQKIISLQYDVEEAEKKLREAEKEQTEWKAVYQRQSGRLLEDNKDLQKKLDTVNKLVDTLRLLLKKSNIAG